MTDKHTPGPWILESYTSGGETRFFVRTRGAIQVDDDGPILGFAIAGGIREADAPLIAAAPEMRKALEAIEPGAGWRGRGPDDTEIFTVSTAKSRMRLLIVFRIQRPAL